MKYKAFFCDFDGTLAAKEEIVSERNRAAIREYIDRGGKFIINSGRMSLPTRRLVDSLGLGDQQVPAIGCNGAHALDKDGKSVFYEGFGREELIKILRYADSLGLYSHFYDDEHVYVRERNRINDEYERITGSPIYPVGDLVRYVAEHAELRPLKALIVRSGGDDESWQAAVDGGKRLGLDGIKSFTSTPYFYEFVSERAGKDAGMRAVAEIYGVDTSECVGMGDGQNDVDMLVAAGLGIAPSSGSEAAKAAASVIAPRADEDAVAWAIEKFCLD